MVYLLVCIAAVAAGLWPDVIRPVHGPRPAPLPTLHALGVGQVLFVLLVWPVVLAGRSLRQEQCGRARRAGEIAGMMTATLPLLLAAGWLGGATVEDVVRLELYVVALWPAGGAMGRMLAGEPCRVVGLLAGLVTALGLPAVAYVAAEFVAGADIRGVWQLAPVTAAWLQADPSSDAWLPAPLWAWALWPAIALPAAAWMRRRPGPG
jgi:hypothetical protein